LFVSQVALEFALIQEYLVLPIDSHGLLLVYTGIYVVVGTALFVVRWQSLKHMLGLAADAGRTALGREPVHPEFAD
jgi:cation:H+ antiporter